MAAPSIYGASPLVHHTYYKPLTDQELLLRLRNFYGLSPEIVNLFTDLESNDPDVEKRAIHTLQFLINNGRSLHDLVLLSLPKQDKGPAIRAIVLHNSESSHPTLRERGLITCSYLVRYEMHEGYELAATLAAKKLRDPDDHIQHEGLKYFMLIMKRDKPDLPVTELALAIPIALRLLITNPVWVDGYRFFDLLITHGKKQNILLAKQSILQACASPRYHEGYKLCETIVSLHYSDTDLLSIPLEALAHGSKSEDKCIHSEILQLCWCFIHVGCPEISIETVVDCILKESKRAIPNTLVLGRLQELTGMDSSNPERSYRGLESNLILQHADSLLEVTLPPKKGPR